MTAKNYQPHQQRVIDEKAELSAKIIALVTFIETNPLFAVLPYDERILMQQQLQAMSEYSRILAQRILFF